MKIKRLLSVGIAATMIMSLLTACGGSGSSSGGSYTAGKYTGSADGKNGAVTVEVELTADSIKSVTVTDHQETEGICEPAIEQIPKAIVDAQSTDVDAVSGATITSDAIKAAVKAAIDSSKK